MLRHQLAVLQRQIARPRFEPDDRGYVLKGRVIVRYDDHEEVLEAGNAFYMTPGHAPEAEAGNELIQFSRADELAATEAAIATLMRSAQDG